MEKRKLQRTGGSSFVITLPKHWIETQKLKKQDTLIISFRKSGSLVIHPTLAREAKVKRRLQIDGLGEQEIIREIIALYVLGTEEIEIEDGSMTHKKRLAVRSALEMLIGFEIVEEGTKSISVKNILSPEKLNLRQSIGKMFSMVYLMFRDALTVFTENKKTLAKDVIERDLEIDKLYFLFLRQNHSLLQDRLSEEEVGLTLEKVNYYENTAHQLERIADHAVKIAQTAEISPLSFQEDLKNLFRETGQKILPFLQEAAFFTQTVDRARAHKVLATLDKTAKDIELLYLKIAQSKFGQAFIVCDSLDRLKGYISNMAEATIDQSFLEE